MPSPISDRKKQKFERRARRSAKQAFRPDIKAAKQDVRKIKAKRERDLTGVDRAVAQVRAGLDRAMNHAENSGLKGKFLQQTLDELQAMKGDSRKMAPILTAEVRQEYASPIASARTGVADLQSARATQARDSYVARLTTAEENKAASAERSQASRERQKETQLAISVGRDFLKLPPPDSASKAAKKTGVPVTEEDWIIFEKAIAGQEGIGLTAARRAVAQLRQQMLANYFGPAVEGVQATAQGVGRAFDPRR